MIHWPLLTDLLHWNISGLEIPPANIFMLKLQMVHCEVDVIFIWCTISHGQRYLFVSTYTGFLEMNDTVVESERCLGHMNRNIMVQSAVRNCFTWIDRVLACLSWQNLSRIASQRRDIWLLNPSSEREAFYWARTKDDCLPLYVLAGAFQCQYWSSFHKCRGHLSCEEDFLKTLKQEAFLVRTVTIYIPCTVTGTAMSRRYERLLKNDDIGYQSCSSKASSVLKFTASRKVFICDFICVAWYVVVFGAEIWENTIGTDSSLVSSLECMIDIAAHLNERVDAW